MANDFIEKELCTVSETQAKQIKEVYIKNQLSEYELYKILCCEAEKEKLYLKVDKLRKHFPKEIVIMRKPATLIAGR